MSSWPCRVKRLILVHVICLYSLFVLIVFTIVFLLLTKSSRDAVHIEWKYNDRNFRLVDTAGLTRIKVQTSSKASSNSNSSSQLSTQSLKEKQLIRAMELQGKFSTMLPGVEVNIINI